MSTVPEFELEQKILEIMNFIRDFAINKNRDVYLNGKKSNFRFAIEGKDVYLDFNLEDV